MPSDPAKRVSNWNTKYNLDRIKAVLEEKRPTMLEHVQSVIPNLYVMEAQVKQVLDAEGVSVITYPFYLNFGREMWRLKRQELSGESLAVEAATLIGKWVARGLAQSVLETIRTQVFDVVAPTP